MQAIDYRRKTELVSMSDLLGNTSVEKFTILQIGEMLANQIRNNWNIRLIRSLRYDTKKDVWYIITTDDKILKLTMNTYEKLNDNSKSDYNAITKYLGDNLMQRCIVQACQVMNARHDWTMQGAERRNTEQIIDGYLNSVGIKSIKVSRAKNVDAVLIKLFNGGY